MRKFIESLTIASFNPKATCFACTASCSTAKGMWNHLRTHGASPGDLALLLQLRQSQEKAGATGLSELESANIAADPLGNCSRILCKVCQHPVSKMSLRRHFVSCGQHRNSPIPATVTSQWLSTKDGRKLETLMRKAPNEELERIAKMSCSSFEAAAENRHAQQAPALMVSRPPMCSFPDLRY